MRNVRDKSYTENQKTFYLEYHISEYRAVEKYDTARQTIDGNIIQPMRFA